MPTTQTPPEPEHAVREHVQSPAGVRRRLLNWFDKARRDLPWRARPGQTPNPYHALVSEAMLQQTQVATVIPYFGRFIVECPTVRDLAEADEQAVLRLWQGLGYYRRARNLHAAAKAIVSVHGGRVPDNVAELLKLPGVGRYTAGAIASIAYNTRAPILDGNVARVLSRLCLIDTPTDATPTQKKLWAIAAGLVPKGRPGDFNQAMMELGALVCTKANPTCDACPLSKQCKAFEADRVADVPVPAKRKAPVQVDHHILAVYRRGRVLFEQRPATGLWSNMWQLPTAEDLNDAAGPATLQDWLQSRTGLTLTDPTRTDTFTHQTTHRTIRFHLWRSTATAGRLRPRAGTWRSLNAIDDLPLPNPQRKAVTLLIDI